MKWRTSTARKVVTCLGGNELDKWCAAQVELDELGCRTVFGPVSALCVDFPSFPTYISSLVWPEMISRLTSAIRGQSGPLSAVDLNSDQKTEGQSHFEDPWSCLPGRLFRLCTTTIYVRNAQVQAGDCCMAMCSFLTSCTAVR
eukprot:6184413-Pleurochrysis_carterae.AAC.5